MRIVVTLLALLVFTQAYAAEPLGYQSVRGPENAGDLYPVEHWRLQMINNPCDESCREHINRTTPGFEYFSRTSCIRAGVEKMIGVLEVRGFLAEAVRTMGFSCMYVWIDD